MTLRIAFAGASGTGKSKLAEWLTTEYGLTKCPIGAREVSAEMGYASPYEVDAAGRRAEFQQLLVRRKIEWEAAQDSFVTDRTVCDNLLYTVLHDIYSVTSTEIEIVEKGMQRYTHVFYCPFSVFCDPGADIARVKSLDYHKVYDTVLRGFFQDFPHTRLEESDFEARKKTISCSI